MPKEGGKEGEEKVRVKRVANGTMKMMELIANTNFSCRELPMERRIPWLLLLLVAACFGAINPFRDKGEGRHVDVPSDTHIRQRESGAELHAHSLAVSFL